MVSSLFSGAYFAEVMSSVQQTHHEGNPISQKDLPDFSLILFACLSQRSSSCHLKQSLHIFELLEIIIYRHLSGPPTPGRECNPRTNSSF